jgi:hypothetical protein
MIIREFSSTISRHISFPFSQTKDFFCKRWTVLTLEVCHFPDSYVPHGILDHLLVYAFMDYSVHFVFTVSVYPTKETVDFHNPNRAGLIE